MAGYKNPEMNKATQQMKESPRAIKITSGSASTRESFDSSQKRAGSMTSSGTPRTSGGISGSGGTKVNPLYKDGQNPPIILPKKNVKSGASDTSPMNKKYNSGQM